MPEGTRYRAGCASPEVRKDKDWAEEEVDRLSSALGKCLLQSWGPA